MNARLLTAVVPVPADFWKVPRLLNVGEPPCHRIVPSNCASNVPVPRLLNMPGPKLPSTIWNEPALQVVVPALFTVRRRRFVPVVVISMPPLAFVVPKPCWVPPSQVNNPVTFTSLEPIRPPPDWVRDGRVTEPSELLMSIVPPVMVSTPMDVTLPVRFIVPPLIVVAVVTLKLPAWLTVPPLPARFVPVILTAASISWVPPPNCSVAPVASNDPAVDVPPPVRFNVPVCTSTVPVLLNAMLLTKVVPVPADFWKVPMLLNVGEPPCHRIVPSNCTSNVPVPRLLKTPGPDVP